MTILERFRTHPTVTTPENTLFVSLVLHIMMRKFFCSSVYLLGKRRNQTDEANLLLAFSHFLYFLDYKTNKQKISSLSGRISVSLVDLYEHLKDKKKSIAILSDRE